MTKYETQFSEGPPVTRGLIVNLLLRFFEELSRLFTLVHEVFHEYLEVVIVVEEVELSLVVFEDLSQVLVGLGEDVQDEWRRVLEVHTTTGAEVDDLVHQFPGLLHRLLVNGGLGSAPRL